MQTISQSNTGFMESQLVEAARAGEVTGLVEYIYRLLPARAERLVRRFQTDNRTRLDVADVVQEGIEQVVRDLHKGLLIDRPVPWLLVAAQHRMLHYCLEFRSVVRVPHSSQVRGAVVPWVQSLDAPLNGEDDLTLLDLLAGVA